MTLFFKFLKTSSAKYKLANIQHHTAMFTGNHTAPYSHVRWQTYSTIQPCLLANIQHHTAMFTGKHTAMFAQSCANYYDKE
jgi:hypothetical protein